MSRFTHAKFSALAAANLAPHTPRHATPVVKMEQRSMMQESEEGDDEEYVSGPSANHKRKRVASSSASAASSSSSSSFSMSQAAPSTSTPQVVSFPLLSDEEPSLHTVLMQTSLAESSSSSSSSERVAPTSFSCVSKFLFSLSDESRDRGSAKLAVIHIALRHPCFSSSGGLHFTTSFKIDGRKSFSNAPFKKFYRRAVHAAWFASSTSNSSATTPAPNAVEVTPTSGRVMLLISQRNGRPNGKGFTGLKHDTASYSSKHPLLCLSSNSVEYYVSVFVNQSTENLEGESSQAQGPESWAEVAAEVSARFDAGEVTLEPVSLPSSVLGAPAVKRQRCVVTLPVSSASSSSSSSAAAAAAMSSMRSVAATAMAESSSSPSSSPPMSRSSSTSVAAVDAESMMQYVEESTPRELASPVPSADSFEQQSSADSPFTDPTEYESSGASAASAGTPLHDHVDHVDMFGSSSSPLTNSELEEPSTAAFHLADDELIGASSSSAEHVWCPMAEQEEVSEEDQLATPNLVRHSSTTSEAVFAFEQQQQQQSQQCSFPVNPFSEDHAHASSSSSSAAPKPHRPRLVIHMDPLFEHGLLPLMSDMSWAATIASFPGRMSPLASPQPQPDHHQQSALPNLTF